MIDIEAAIQRVIERCEEAKHIPVASGEDVMRMLAEELARQREGEVEVSAMISRELGLTK